MPRTSAMAVDACKACRRRSRSLLKVRRRGVVYRILMMNKQKL